MAKVSKLKYGREKLKKKNVFPSSMLTKENTEMQTALIDEIMLMCRKVTHKNLIDSSPLFPCNKEKAIHNLHLNDIILLGQSKGKIKVYAP